MRRILVFAGTSLLLASVVVCTSGAQATEPRAGIAADLILQRFSIAKGGDSLLLPVRFGGREHPFVVDTGCAKTCFDAAAPLGKPTGVERVSATQGKIVLNTYDPPLASVGAIPCRFGDSVMAMDLKPFREVIGYPIEGVLGMDFLGQQVIHVDFDRGELLFLKTAPAGSSGIIPMYWEPDEIPEVDAFLTGVEKVRFTIDTGHGSRYCGSLRTRELRSLLTQRQFRKVSSSLKLSAAGRFSAPTFKGSFLALGGFAVEGPVFSESSTHNLLGLGLWSRFVVTFDFPGRRVLLSKGAGYGRPDRWNLSGLHFVRKDGAVVVEQVDDGSAGRTAGIREGDVLLELGGVRAGEASLFELGAALCRVGQTQCTVRRGSQTQMLSINLTQ